MNGTVKKQLPYLVFLIKIIVLAKAEFYGSLIQSYLFFIELQIYSCNDNVNEKK